MTMSNGVVVVPSSLVAAHVDVDVVGASVGEAVDEPGIAVIGEDDGLARGEERVELRIGETADVRCRAEAALGRSR